MLGATGDNVSVTNKHWRILLWASMLLFTAWVVWSARIALLPFAFGAVVAYALSPVVDRLASLIPARTRTHDVLRRGAVVLVIVAAMVERPELLQRPIVVNGEKAVLARPIERALEVL